MALRDQLSGIERRYASTRPAQAGPPLPPETVEKLKPLGYRSYGVAAQPATSGPLPDPKDRLTVFKSVMRAHALNEAGHYEESNRLLELLSAKEPGLFVIPFLKGENLSKLEHWPEAAKSYQDCLKINPTFDRALMGVARAYVALGQKDNANSPITRWGESRAW